MHSDPAEYGKSCLLSGTTCCSVAVKLEAKANSVENRYDGERITNRKTGCRSSSPTIDGRVDERLRR